MEARVVSCHMEDLVVLRRTSLLLALICVGPLLMGAEKPKPAVSWSKDLSTAHAAMVKSQRPLMMYFTTAGCSYCKKMKAETFKDQDVAKEVQLRYIAVQVDAKQYPKLAKQLKLRFYPTTAIVQPSGKVVEVVHGYKAAEPFTKHLVAAKRKLTESKLASKTKTVAKK